MDDQTEANTVSAERRVVILVHGAIAGASLAAALELASREALIPLLLAALGFLLIFWSFHWIIGMIFLVASIVAFATIWMEERHLRNTKKIRKESLEHA
jgi:ABC-type protease/lipase transport system fused ATPase/permease subunit